MDNDRGLSHYLLSGGADGGSPSHKLDELAGLGPGLSQQQDDDNLVVAQLINEMNNIKEVSDIYCIFSNFLLQF